MGDRQIRTQVNDWAAAFERALATRDGQRLRALLGDPAYLRDNGALTWDLRQFHGRDQVVSTLLSIADEITPHSFCISEKWPAPQRLGEGESAVIEAFLDFKTRHGSAILLLNAVAAGDASSELLARAIFTRLEGLEGLEPPTRHPRGRGYTPSFPGETWKEHREAARRYENGDPEVLVVGAGQAGVVTAAYLRRFGIDVLNIERNEKVGDSWSQRYDSLALHNPVEMNGFPFLPFPPHYPEYLSKDTMGEWLDLYARYMDLNVWTGTEFVGAQYDDQAQRWSATVRTAHGQRVLRPKHIVLATGGIGGKPNMPQLPTLERFAGKVLHSSQFTKCADYGAKRAILIGVATSAHDIARDLCEGGVEVVMFQRGPVVVNHVETANLAYAGYLDPTTPTELVDVRYGIGLINPLREAASQAYHQMAKKLDEPLLKRLAAAGLRLGDGVNGQGWLDLFLRSGGGYYLNTGASELIAEGKIKIEQFERIAEFTADGAKLDDGRIINADLIVLATGYQGRLSEVVDGFGPEVAERVGEIARLDDEGEWSNMWGQTGQRGLWFNGGGINQMRSGSERLALLITADLKGLIPEGFRRRPKTAKRPDRRLQAV
jgi:putative flavoprotein involved in K+ transport